jgi:hypothetical protein
MTNDHTDYPTPDTGVYPVPNVGAVVVSTVAKVNVPNYQGPNKRKPWEEHEDYKLIKDWRTCVAIEVIADELGRSTSDVKRRRKFLCLPVRRYLVRRTSIKVNVDETMGRGVGRRARERGQSVSEYIRYLIKRDLGHAV